MFPKKWEYKSGVNGKVRRARVTLVGEVWRAYAFERILPGGGK